MDSEFPSPAKRSRGSFNGNVQLTECVREFKLPRQFPSMITKVSFDVVNDNNRTRSNFDGTVTCLPKTSIENKFLTINQENSTTNGLRKIKLKGKDGRDLGEINVQHLPQNIQGKTITLSKNGFQKSPEIVLAGDKIKGMTLGVLTPVNIIKKEISYCNNFPPLLTINNDQKKNVTAKDSKKTITVEQKPMSAVMDQQGRPQVLVFQSGKNWHMVKIASTAPVQASQNETNITAEEVPVVPNSGKLMHAKGQSQNANMEIHQNKPERLLPRSKISSTNQTKVVAKQRPQSGVPDNTGNRCKSKSVVASENADSRPKIEISRVFGSSSNKPVSQIHPVAQTTELLSKNKKSVLIGGCTQQKKRSLRQDEMVILPSDIPSSLNTDSMVLGSQKVVTFPHKETNCDDKSKSEKSLENVRCQSSRFSTPCTAEAREPHKDQCEKGEISGNLKILTKALGMVQDEELRAKALKALADCGIGIEKLVPIIPPAGKRSVKDSCTQTSVFGIFEPEHFIHVNPSNEAIERIRPIERKSLQKIGHIIGNPHIQESSLNSADMTNWITGEPNSEVTAMVEAYLAENEGISEVRNIFAKPHPVRHKLASTLEEDFQMYKIFDDNGLLNIHRAVVANDLPAVTRQLKVLKACGESPDVPTVDGQTSLELAVRYEVSSKIIETLLDYGAEPTSLETGHDSALLIASKKSLPILTDLIPYVTAEKTLDNYDSSGFAALHYCAQNNNKSGVIELAGASADVNLRDRRSGRTALFHAVENENIELAKVLLDKGAQASIPTYSGHTVFALLEDGRHYSLIESLNRAQKNTV